MWKIFLELHLVLIRHISSDVSVHGKWYNLSNRVTICTSLLLEWNLVLVLAAIVRWWLCVCVRKIPKYLSVDIILLHLYFAKFCLQYRASILKTLDSIKAKTISSLRRFQLPTIKSHVGGKLYGNFPVLAVGCLAGMLQVTSFTCV